MLHSPFWMHSKSPTLHKAEVIIWGKSQTWKALSWVIWKTQWNMLILTSRSGTNISIGSENSIDIWLDLSAKKSAEEIAKWVVWQVDMLLCGEITLHLHAMSMNGIDTQYPEKIVSEIKKYTNAIVNVVYISYENGYDRDKNSRGSHVSYDARATKDALETSVNNSQVPHSIVDLIVFDSPSAKVLWPTFVWVVWDFLDFFKHRFWDDFTQQFFSDDMFTQGFVGVSEFLQHYPLRWSLSEWQSSMKELAEKWQFQSVINKYTKVMNFWHLSFMSGDISQLYLNLAMSFIHQNEVEILSNPERTLLTWEKITKNLPDQQLLNLIWRTKAKILARKNKKILRGKKKERFDTPVSIFLKSHSGKYIINPEKLNVPNQHFWIVPMMFQHHLASLEALWPDEEITQIKCPSQMYSWEELEVIRNENEVIIKSANSWEIFTEIKISKREELKKPDRKPSVEIKKEDLESKETLEAMSPETPHRDEWIEQFLNGIPNIVEGTQIGTQSAILENIWFKVWALIKTKPEFLIENFWVKTDDLKKLKGMFGTIKIWYLAPKFEEIIKSWDFTIEMEEFKIRELKWEKILSTKINIISNDEVIGAYSIVWL